MIGLRRFRRFTVDNFFGYERLLTTFVDHTFHVLFAFPDGNTLQKVKAQTEVRCSVRELRHCRARRTSKTVLRLLMMAITVCLSANLHKASVAQDQQLRAAAGIPGAAGGVHTEITDGPKGTTLSPAQTGEHRPLYRLRKSDVLEISFTFSPEFNQTLTVQPDGFVNLKGIGDMYIEGMIMEDLRAAVRKAYVHTLYEAEVSIVLKDFDKPYFIATGELMRPGKFELRADTTVTEGIAIAGGFTEQAKHSRVILFRRLSSDVVESKVVDVKAMLKSGNLSEDMHLQPGDLIFVPKNTMSKLRRYLPTSSLGGYLNPATF